MNIEDIYKKYESALMRMKNVTGVGVGEKNGKEVIIVFVREKVPESDLQRSDVIPKKLDGVETDVRIEIRVG